MSYTETTINEVYMNEMYRIAHDDNILLSLMIEVLTSCNERCKHCYIPEHSSMGMELDKIKDIIYQFRKLGGLNLSLTGGEIFLRSDIFDIIQYAREQKLRVFLLTNGTCITREVAIKLRELYISELSVSVYSLDPNIHDEITGVKGSLERTLNGISYAKEQGIHVTIKTPLMELNKYCYRDLKKYCEKNDFNYIASAIIFAKSNGDTSVKKLAVNREDLKVICKEIEELEYKGNNLQFEEACGSLKYTLAIDANGNVFPCNSLYYKIGNICDSTLKELKECNELRRIQNILKKDLISCQKCVLKEQCSRCPGLALLEDGNLLGCSSSAQLNAQLRL